MFSSEGGAWAVDQSCSGGALVEGCSEGVVYNNIRREIRDEMSIFFYLANIVSSLVVFFFRRSTKKKAQHPLAYAPLPFERNSLSVAFSETSYELLSF